MVDVILYDETCDSERDSFSLILAFDLNTVLCL